MKKIIDKLRNPILISSLLSTFFLILSGFNIIKITDNTINIIVNSIMSILSFLGVLHVPSKSIKIKKNNTNNDRDV